MYIERRKNKKLIWDFFFCFCLIEVTKGLRVNYHSINIGAMNTGVTVQDAAVKSISLKTDFQLPNKLDIFVGECDI